MIYRDSTVNERRREAMPAWVVDGTPPWVLECLATFPPHASSRLSRAAATPAGLGLLKALADMAKQGVLQLERPPVALSWAGWTYRPPSHLRPPSWAPREGWERC